MADTKQTMDKWITQIDQITSDFEGTFRDLSEEQLNWQPHENAWSIAQNMRHLILINESYFSILDSLRDGRYHPPFLSRFHFLSKLIGRTLLKSVQPDRKVKTKTYPIWEPDEQTNQDKILDRFVRHQDELKDQIKNSRELVANGAVICSPANKNIVYPLETAFDILIAHERRHFVQAKEILPK